MLALAVLSTAFVNLAIGVGFEREYGVLKRLGATPLGRPRLLGAKTLAILAVEAVQVAVLWPLALALGWDPSPRAGVRAGGRARHRRVRRAWPCAWPARCKALVTLAAANGLYLVLLLLSGMVIPLDELPDAAAGARPCALPSAALAEVVRGTLTDAGRAGPAWAVLAVLGGRRARPRHPPVPLGVNSPDRGPRAARVHVAALTLLRRGSSADVSTTGRPVRRRRWVSRR